jgi:hypothetical protein
MRHRVRRQVPKGAKLRTFQFTLESGFGPETGEWILGY